jgi:hypothetical protein
LGEPPLIALGERGEMPWVDIYTRLDHCGRERVVTIVTSVAPELLRLEEVESIGKTKAERLRQQGIKDVMDLAKADAAKIATAFAGMPATAENDPATVKNNAEARLATLRAEHKGFKPPR